MSILRAPGSARGIHSPQTAQLVVSPSIRGLFHHPDAEVKALFIRRELVIRSGVRCQTPCRVRLPEAQGVYYAAAT